MTAPAERIKNDTVEALLAMTEVFAKDCEVGKEDFDIYVGRYDDAPDYIKEEKPGTNFETGKYVLHVRPASVATQKMEDKGSSKVFSSKQYAASMLLTLFFVKGEKETDKKGTPEDIRKKLTSPIGFSSDSLQGLAKKLKRYKQEAAERVKKGGSIGMNKTESSPAR